VTLNLFYEEPDDDRWFPYDRYPRRILRRIVRGGQMVGGQQRVFLNLCAGLDQLGVRYRVNDYRYARTHPTEAVGIVGKPLVLDRMGWTNPILFGAAVYSHPTDDPDLLERLPVKRILVPGEWMRKMCEPYWNGVAYAWPVGIDTDRWSDAAQSPKDIDVLLYDKIRWDRERYVPALLDPIRTDLQRRRLRIHELRYGFYRERDFHELLGRSRSMVFLCEHETQGIAYQQALSRNVPIFAWDRGGFWQDPSYYPHRVSFEPVTSVPYWNDACGNRFADATGFTSAWTNFWTAVTAREFTPRSYVVDHLSLKHCAGSYLEHITAIT
jgi:hypothetical protein